jgi:hypothetical protein
MPATTIGTVLVACLAARAGVVPHHDDDVDLEPGQISGEFLEPIGVPITIATLDRYVSNPRRNQAPATLCKIRRPRGYRSSRDFNKPITGSFPFCCAPAASGVAAAAPPISVMTSRRLILILIKAKHHAEHNQKDTARPLVVRE